MRLHSTDAAVRVRRTPVLVAGLAMSLMLGATACSGDNSGATSKADLTKQLSERLRDSDGLDKEAADCLATLIVDEAGVKALKDLDLTAEVPSKELQDAIAAAAVPFVEEC